MDDENKQRVLEGLVIEQSLADLLDSAALTLAEQDEWRQLQTDMMRAGYGVYVDRSTSIGGGRSRQTGHTMPMRPEHRERALKLLRAHTEAVSELGFILNESDDVPAITRKQPA